MSKAQVEVPPERVKAVVDKVLSLLQQGYEQEIL